MVFGTAAARQDRVYGQTKCLGSVLGLLWACKLSLRIQIKFIGFVRSHNNNAPAAIVRKFIADVR